MRYYRYLLALTLLVTCNFLNAQIILPKILGNNMVLQRGKPLPVWGWASVGEHITVKFDKQIKETIVDSSKHWQVMLNPMPASDKPQEMVISGSNTITLTNILVGEVWLCSGQSNMEYSMRKNSNFAQYFKGEKQLEDELKTAKNSDIRIFLVNRKFMKPDSLHKGWNIAKDSALRPFSAVGYFFAKELYKELHVPIGMISSAVSGSNIEPWISSDTFYSSPYFREKDTLKRSKEVGKFYPSMIQPLAPFALSGMLWYQGETNCFLAETIQYAYKMRVLIDSWRNAWLDKSLPFYFVEIAQFRYSQSKGKVALTKETLPEFREAQALALRLPNTGMAVITDLVPNPDDIHPPYKAEVGRRLSLLALAQNFGKKVVFSGPMYKQMKIEGNKIEIEFDHCGSGLVSNDGKPLDWFTIAGADGKFVSADAVIKGDNVIVSSPSVPSPVAVRFAWSEEAQPNFFNIEGLPAVPFRTDNPLFKVYQP